MRFFSFFSDKIHIFNIPHKIYIPPYQFILFMSVFGTLIFLVWQQKMGRHEQFSTISARHLHLYLESMFWGEVAVEVEVDDLGWCLAFFSFRLYFNNNNNTITIINQSIEKELSTYKGTFLSKKKNQKGVNKTNRPFLFFFGLN